MKEAGQQRKETPASRVALMGMIFALAMVLSFLEGMIPALPMLPPGVKLGLSNIATMYALFFLGVRSGLTIAVLKSLFVFLTRGATGAVMSLAGGLASVCIMALFWVLPKVKLSISLVSILGAVFHNLGQLVAARVIIGNSYVFGYLPIMLLAGVVMGVVTGLVLKLVLPYLSRMNWGLSKNLR